MHGDWEDKLEWWHQDYKICKLILRHQWMETGAHTIECSISVLISKRLLQKEVTYSSRGMRKVKQGVIRSRKYIEY